MHMHLPSDYQSTFFLYKFHEYAFYDLHFVLCTNKYASSMYLIQDDHIWIKK